MYGELQETRTVTRTTVRVVRTFNGVSRLDNVVSRCFDFLYYCVYHLYKISFPQLRFLFFCVLLLSLIQGVPK